MSDIQNPRILRLFKKAEDAFAQFEKTKGAAHGMEVIHATLTLHGAIKDFTERGQSEDFRAAEELFTAGWYMENAPKGEGGFCPHVLRHSGGALVHILPSFSEVEVGCSPVPSDPRLRQRAVLNHLEHLTEERPDQIRRAP